MCVNEKQLNKAFIKKIKCSKNENWRGNEFKR